MRICLIARNRFHGDRKALVTFRALQQAGHEVSVVAVDRATPRPPVTTTVSPRLFRRPLMRRLDRLVPSRLRRRVTQRRLNSAAAAAGADIYLPLHPDVLAVAVAAASHAGGVVQRTPAMEDVDALDLISVAPSRPDLAMPVDGAGPHFTPGHEPTPYRPAPSRHQGMKVVLCYRKTAANPGRYLESALGRAGIDVRVETDVIDMASIDADTAFVLFVESPYPAITVTGETTVPTLFWVHHGEHHLNANLRLTNRYRADAVLLAHSWHLAHWFPAPIHRFPFAVPPELFPPLTALADRKADVAMVGSQLRSGAWQYRRRRQIVTELESHLPPDRLRFVEGVSPEEMAGIYADSRIVINEGGVRHYPITMRVFEAVGAGAVLLSDPIPGLEMIFTSGIDYAPLGSDVVSDVQGLLDDLTNAGEMATRANDNALDRHTYDHRVDLLVEIAAGTTKREIPPPPPRDDLSELVATDVEVQRIVHDGADGLDAQLPDREVWPVSEREGRLTPASMDAAVVSGDRSHDPEPLLAAARRYIYTVGDVPGLEDYLRVRHPDAVVQRHGRLTRVDLMAAAYRVSAPGKTS